MRKREIFIELTSLLDVILIMLFVLLIQARTQTADAKNSAETAVSRLAAAEQSLDAERIARRQAETERDSLARRVVTDSLVLDNSVILTISTLQDGTILTEIENGESRQIPYSWENDTYALNSLREQCAGFLEQADETGKSMFVVFQFDRNRILHAEYEMIVSVTQKMREDAKAAGAPLSYIEADIAS